MLASGSVPTVIYMSPVRHPSPAQRRHAASARRDGALNRLSTITGSIAVASLAAVAAMGIYVAKALPGHHATTTTSVSSGSSANGGGASSSANTLNPPSSSPTAASTPPPVTSGVS